MIHLVNFPPLLCLCNLIRTTHHFCIFTLFCVLFSPLCLPLSSQSLPPLPSTPSLQAQRTGATQGPQHGAQETAPGLHWPAAPHAHRHLQGKQASIQGNADHHLPAAWPGAQHRQQLLHERAPPLRGPLARWPRCQPRAAGHIGHHLLQGLRGGEDLQRAQRPGWNNRRHGKLAVRPVFNNPAWPRTIWMCPLPEKKKSFVPCNHLFCQSEFQALTWNKHNLKVNCEVRSTLHYSHKDNHWFCLFWKKIIFMASDKVKRHQRFDVFCWTVPDIYAGLLPPPK